MSFTFYHVSMSTSSITQAVMAELELNATVIELDIDAGDTQTAEFLRINPNGRVPVLVHEGVVISESAAITLYLGDLFGVDKQLFPISGTRRGEAMKWTVWGNMNLADAAGKLAAELSLDAPGAVLEGSRDFVPLARRHPENLEKANAQLMQCFSILNGALKDRSFILSEYSIVDTHLFVLVGWILSMEIDLSAYPQVEAWFNRCLERPVLSSMMQDE